MQNVKWYVLVSVIRTKYKKRLIKLPQVPAPLLFSFAYGGVYVGVYVYYCKCIRHIAYDYREYNLTSARNVCTFM